MDESRHEKIAKKSPEKGLSSSGDDSISDSEKSDKKSSGKPSKELNEKPRRASFFADKETRKSEPTLGTVFGEPNEVEKIKKEPYEKKHNSKDDESDGLSESEANELVGMLIDERDLELQEEVANVEEDSPEELSIIADALFLESLREHLESDEDLTEAAIEDAYQEVVADLGIERAIELNDFEADHTVGELHEADSDDFVDSGPLEETPYIDTVTVDEDEQNTTPPTSGPTEGSRAGGASSHGSGSGDSGHGSSTGGGHVGGGGGGIRPTPPIGVTPHIYYGPYAPLSPPAPPGLSPPAAPAAESEPYRRNNRGHDLLVGALVGYVIGRRGGRKRTERRFKPEITKLENEVATLHDTIALKEEKIRTVARKLAESRAVTGKPDAKTIVERRVQRLEVKKTLRRREQLMKKESVTKLGSLRMEAAKIFRERRLIDGSENSSKRRPVEIMTIPELLERVDTLVIRGIAVVEAYHAGRLSDGALRNITKEYMRSQNFETTFYRELRSGDAELGKNRARIAEVHEGIQRSNGGQLDQDLYERASRNSTEHRSRIEGGELVNRGIGNTVEAQLKANREQAKKVPKPIYTWIAIVVAVVLISTLFLLYNS